MVRRELARDPSVGKDALRAKALGLDRRVRRLSPLQFHATYRFPAVRAASAANGAAAPHAAAGGSRSTKRVRRSASEATPSAASPAETVLPGLSNRDAASHIAPKPTARGGVELSASAADAHAVGAAAPPPTSMAVARPHAAEREAERSILQTVAREALGTEDRVGFVRLFDGLDERASVGLGVFARR